MNWFITGGCGFIGLQLVSRLLEDVCNRVTVYDNFSVGAENDLSTLCLDLESKGVLSDPGRVKLIEGDVLDYRKLVSSSAGADVFVHLAANTGVGPSVTDPALDLNVNVLGTFNALQAARENKVRRFVFASSGAPVGEVDPPIHEEVCARPVSPYGASKLSGEAYCSAFFRTYGVETVTLRFSNVYGPGSSRKSSAVAKFIKDGLSGEPMTVYGDGTQTRDFIFVQDLVGAIFKAGTVDGVAGELFQISTGVETSINDLISNLEKTFANNGRFFPPCQFSKARNGDVRRNYSDPSKAKSLLGWAVSVSLKDGLDLTFKDLIAWKNNSE